ncbi:hypothetical protein, variant [Pyricularia oryzae 70-15]|uniref:Uncharacterized protein n=1 Tax=Pyricularia oryzae (strain 70-15 / ATCC MYA-4617 / FGSC 8958) TaxID=242507 RepID=G4NH02_PYRO7|nr:hypothetical protein, variant [Pyricularia oryzae 70-15]EHA47512.1 hypothetical protein, variant [Pyricularia oryzae 70-15]
MLAILLQSAHFAPRHRATQASTGPRRARSDLMTGFLVSGKEKKGTRIRRKIKASLASRAYACHAHRISIVHTYCRYVRGVQSHTHSFTLYGCAPRSCHSLPLGAISIRFMSYSRYFATCSMGSFVKFSRWYPRYCSNKSMDARRIVTSSELPKDPVENPTMAAVGTKQGFFG